MHYMKRFYLLERVNILGLPTLQLMTAHDLNRIADLMDQGAQGKRQCFKNYFEGQDACCALGAVAIGLGFAPHHLDNFDLPTIVAKEINVSSQSILSSEDMLILDWPRQPVYLYGYIINLNDVKKLPFAAISNHLRAIAQRLQADA